MTSAEKLKKYPELYRAEISCKIACQAINGEIKEIDEFKQYDFAICNIAAAIGDIAAAMMKQQEQAPEFCQCQKLWPSKYCPDCGKRANHTRKEATERGGQ